MIWGEAEMMKLRLASLAIFVAALARPVAAEDAVNIDGRWTIVSVEFAGANVPGLKAAEVVFADGEKLLTLPDGRIEKGTYKLDASKRPRQIDSKTESKSGTEEGIYAIEEDTLRLCLATAGGPRPAEFATLQGTDQILIILRRAPPNRDDAEPPPPTGRDIPTSPDNGSPQKPTGSRTFRMGFTGFVYDMTLEAVTASHEFVRENGDILCHHIEGVPWTEALHNRPFPAELVKEWEGKKSATPPDGKVYLAISPGRGELKVADKAGLLPAELHGKSYDDPLVMRAYLSYCRRAIEFFDPDYLAIGIEVNEIHNLGERSWQAYAALHNYVYTELKKDHKDLPIFASWTLHHMFQKRGAMPRNWKALMPQNDLVAVSYYPFMVADKDRLAALDWMSGEFEPFKKPFAMVETNDAAERLPLPEAKVVIEGTPEKQEAYYRKLLALAHEHEFEFVISFVHQDYDALWQKIKGYAPEAFLAWRDCGLVDEDGNPRPAYQVWKEYFSLPLDERRP
jgi:uncharacterized protein (TIGR03067 family)